MGCKPSKAKAKEEPRIPTIEEAGLLDSRERLGPPKEEDQPEFTHTEAAAREGERGGGGGEREGAVLLSDQGDRERSRSHRSGKEELELPHAEETTAQPSEAIDHHAFMPSDCELEDDPSLGEVLLTVQYNASNEELKLRIRKSRNILQRAPQFSLFFKTALFPDPTKKYLFQTETKHSSVEALFDETFTFQKITEHDMERKILQIAAFDEALDPQNAYIGEISIRLAKLGIEFELPRWVPLSKMPDDAMPVSSPPPKATPTKSEDAYSVNHSIISSMSAMSISGVVKSHDFGKVHLSIHYKLSKQTLQVVVIAARLNKPSGSSGLPTPYAKLYIIPDPSKKSKQKTKAEKGTLDPTFNESFEFKMDKTYADKKLQVTIWDQVFGKNTFLGEALISLSAIPPNETVNKWFPLESLSHGELNCRIVFDHTNEYLTVTIVKARNLVSSRGNSVDPYVKIYLLPDKKKQSKKKTHYRKQTVNPEFNETFQYFLGDYENPAQRFLHISVLDHNSVGNNDVIGSCSIPIIDIVDAKTMDQWFPLIKDKISAQLG